MWFDNYRDLMEWLGKWAPMVAAAKGIAAAEAAGDPESVIVKS